MDFVTVVEGKIPVSKREKFETAYSDLKYNPTPVGLIKTRLLRDNASGIYRLETRWSSKDAIENMQKTQTPAAKALFEKIGVVPNLNIFELVDEFEH